MPFLVGRCLLGSFFMVIPFMLLEVRPYVTPSLPTSSFPPSFVPLFVGWLVGWLVVGSLVGWLAGGLVARWVGYIGWLARWGV